MGTHVCFHCGELYDEKRLVCPHCGADREFTYGETPTESVASEWSDQDDAAYQRFLEQEGLAKRRPVSRKPLWWGLFILVVISGLILVLL